MATKYQLPCTQCDQQVAITAGQAGDTVRCECGAELNVPTMRGIRDLEVEGASEGTAESHPKSSAPSWGPRQGALLLGTVVALAAAAVGVYQWTQMPAQPRITPEANLRAELVRIDGMSPSESWVFWHQDILHYELSQLQSTQEFKYEARARVVRPRMIFFFIVAGLGVVLAICSIFFPRTL